MTRMPSLHAWMPSSPLRSWVWAKLGFLPYSYLHTSLFFVSSFFHHWIITLSSTSLDNTAHDRIPFFASLCCDTTTTACYLSKHACRKV